MNGLALCGAYYDTATGLYKMGARYYDPYVGRFTQRDPFPASAYGPLSYDRCVYVADNPANYVDATCSSCTFVCLATE